MHNSAKKAFNTTARRAAAAAKPGDGVVDDALARFDCRIDYLAFATSGRI